MENVFTFGLTIRALSAPHNPSNGLSGWRGGWRSLQRISYANGIRGWCGNADDALLRVGAARRDLYTSFRPRMFCGVGLWMARRNLALRCRGACMGIRGAVEMERSPHERLGGYRSRRRCRPRGAARKADVIDAATARRWAAVRHVEKSIESVADPNALDKRSPIDNSLGQACVDDGETNDVGHHRLPVCKREHDGFVGRYKGAVPDNTTLIDIYGSRRSRRLCGGGLQRQSATDCQHEPGDASPIAPVSSHGEHV